MAVLTARHRRLALVSLLAAAITAGGARRPPTEREVEAAFLCSFAEYVEWPDRRPEAPLALLVLGDDPFGALLDETVASRPAQSKPIEVRHSRRLEDAGRAQIVYVSDSEMDRLDEVLAATATAGILTVSRLPGFARRGGIVGFVLEQRRVRFEINQGAAERAGLRVSSRLLNLARIVETAPAER